VKQNNKRSVCVGIHPEYQYLQL